MQGFGRETVWIQVPAPKREQSKQQHRRHIQKLRRTHVHFNPTQVPLKVCIDILLYQLTVCLGFFKGILFLFGQRGPTQAMIVTK